MFHARRAPLIWKPTKENTTIAYRGVFNARTVLFTTLQELSRSRLVSLVISLTQTTVNHSATMFQLLSPQFIPDTDPRTATPLLKCGERTSSTSTKILNVTLVQSLSPRTSSAVHLSLVAPHLQTLFRNPSLSLLVWINSRTLAKTLITGTTVSLKWWS